MTTITDQATINSIRAAYNAACNSRDWQPVYQLGYGDSALNVHGLGWWWRLTPFRCEWLALAELSALSP